MANQISILGIGDYVRMKSVFPPGSLMFDVLYGIVEIDLSYSSDFCIAYTDPLGISDKYAVCSMLHRTIEVISEEEYWLGKTLERIKYCGENKMG